MMHDVHQYVIAVAAAGKQKVLHTLGRELYYTSFIRMRCAWRDVGRLSGLCVGQGRQAERIDLHALPRATSTTTFALTWNASGQARFKGPHVSLPLSLRLAPCGRISNCQRGA